MHQAKMLRFVSVCAVLSLASLLYAQDANPKAARTDVAKPATDSANAQSVPKLIKFSGSVKVDSSQTSATTDAAAPQLTPPSQGLTFSIYSAETGGDPLFVETQNITPDAQGKYSVLLGSSHREGLPTEIFSENSARWLAIRTPDGVDQPRVMLVAVPYALKSVDTEKLGGKDAADFVQSADLSKKVGDLLAQDYGLSKDDLKSKRLAARVKDASEAPHNGASAIMTVSGENGNVFRINNDGGVFSSGGYFVGGADFAESVETVSAPAAYEQGDVMVIDPAKPRTVDLSDTTYSTMVAGIVSTKPGLLGSQYSDPTDTKLDKEVPLAVVGIVPCKVSAENGEIKIGDMLVTSSTVGYAMKGTDRSKMLGAVLGKAMEPLKSGKGVIQVLVTLQ